MSSKRHCSHRLYCLDTDASDKSIGAVLSQVQDGQERVIAYAGRSLSKNEMNYCAYRKELLAVVYFTRHFKQYLLSSRFLLRTDNSSVSWLQKTPEPLGQNARWHSSSSRSPCSTEKAPVMLMPMLFHVTRASTSRPVLPPIQKKRLSSLQHAVRTSE